MMSFMRRVVLLAVATAVALPLCGCGGTESKSTLTVEGLVVLCPTNGDCVNLPAAGGAVRVFDEGGNQVLNATLDEQGRHDFTVPAGNYTASLAMPGLGVHTDAKSRASVSLSGDGDDGLLAINLPAIPLS